MESMNTGGILISVVTVCFNSENTIEKTIKSVLGQQFRNFEYIIVDGGSKDRTMDIVRKYEPLFKGRMRYVSEPDKGWYDAMNKGIGMAEGRFVNFLNSDDYYESDALSAVGEFIQNINVNNDAIVYGDSTNIYISSKGQTLYRKIVAPSFIDANHSGLKDGMCGVRHQSMFVGKEVYNSIGSHDLKFRLHADWDFFIKTLKKGVRYYYVNKNFTYYSMNGASTTLDCKERHLVRKENDLYSGVDWSYAKDKFGLKTAVMRCMGSKRWNDFLFWTHSRKV